MGIYNRLIRFSFAAVLAMNAGLASAFAPENGWWWNPDESGRGFNLEVQNATVFLATFIYDGDGNAVWYSGAGVLDDQTVTIDLVEVANGQCIACDYQEPQVVETVETATIRFNSTDTAELDWSNGTVSIQRFNFSYGDSWQQKLLGDWAIVIGGNVFPAYKGDRINFKEILNDAVNGSRVGNSNAEITIFEDTDNTVDGYDYSGLMTHTLSKLRVYAFNINSFNRIDGITVDVDRNLGQDGILDALATQGVPFIAFRVD